MFMKVNMLIELSGSPSMQEKIILNDKRLILILIFYLV